MAGEDGERLRAEEAPNALSLFRSDLERRRHKEAASRQAARL